MAQNAVSRYMKESLQELHKVTWPTKNQAIRLTIITLAFTFISAAFLLGVDYVLGGIYDLVFTTQQ